MQPINAWSNTQYAPVPGLSELLTQRNRDTRQAFSDIGQFAGSAVAAGIGAKQAADHPEQFSPGTSTGMAALKGGLMNFNKAFTGDGESFKQFAAMGKAADGVFNATLTAASSTTPQDKEAVGLGGITKTQWQHFGTADKINALKTWDATQKAQATMLGYDTALQHFAQVQQQSQAQQEATAAWKRFGNDYTAARSPQLNAGSDGFSMFVNNAVGNGVTPGKTVNGQDMLDMALRAGVSPQDAFSVARSGAEVAKATKDLNNPNGDGFFRPTDLSQPLPSGYARIVTGPNTSQVVAIPNADGPITATTGNYFFDGKKWMTTKGDEVSPDKVLASYDRENASLTAQLPFAPEDERAQMQAQIKANQQKIQALRSGGRTATPAGSAASRFKIVEVK